MRRNGYYGKRKRYVKWQCVPDDGSAPHMIRPELSMRLHGGRGGHCIECERRWGPTDGIPAARGDRFTLRAKAAALMRLAEGRSYREAAEHARRQAGRGLMPSREGRIAAEWLSRYAPIIIDRHLPREWPKRSLVLDKLPIHVRDFDSDTPKPSGKASFFVFGALSYDGPRARLWRMAVSERANAEAWVSFFRSLPGQPQYVVCDRDPAMLNAIRRMWPQARIYPCVDHLRLNVETMLKEGGLHNRQEPLVQLLSRTHDRQHPFTYPENYGRFCAAMRELLGRDRSQMPPKAVRALEKMERWLAEVGPEIARSLVEKHYPVSTGALEHELRRIKLSLRDRRYNLRHLPRLELLLQLHLVRRAGSTDERNWSRILREHHAARGGVPAPLTILPDPQLAPVRRPGGDRGQLADAAHERGSSKAPDWGCPSSAGRLASCQSLRCSYGQDR